MKDIPLILACVQGRWGVDCLASSFIIKDLTLIKISFQTFHIYCIPFIFLLFPYLVVSFTLSHPLPCSIPYFVLSLTSSNPLLHLIPYLVLSLTQYHPTLFCTLSHPLPCPIHYLAPSLTLSCLLPYPIPYLVQSLNLSHPLLHPFHYFVLSIPYPVM